MPQLPGDAATVSRLPWLKGPELPQFPGHSRCGCISPKMLPHSPSVPKGWTGTPSGPGILTELYLLYCYLAIVFLE